MVEIQVLAHDARHYETAIIRKFWHNVHDTVLCAGRKTLMSASIHASAQWGVQNHSIYKIYIHKSLRTVEYMYIFILKAYRKPIKNNIQTEMFKKAYNIKNKPIQCL